MDIEQMVRDGKISWVRKDDGPVQLICGGFVGWRGDRCRSWGRWAYSIGDNTIMLCWKHMIQRLKRDERLKELS